MPPDLHPLLASRTSPRRFDPEHVLEPDGLRLLLEAARWAPSSGNTQPARWLVARRGDPAHQRLVACLTRRNREWAPRASALLLAAALTANDKGPLPEARHDVGQAVAHLTVQAEAAGLKVHQMAGFDRDAVRTAFALPEVLEPAVVVAVGVVGGPELPEDLRAREARSRRRLPLAELLLTPLEGA